MINMAKYPYALNSLSKIIDKETSFLAKYFFMLDLFDALVKYLYFLSVSFIENDKNDNYQTAENVLENLGKTIDILAGQNAVFIPELGKLKQTPAWNKIINFQKKKAKEIEKKLGSESYYKKIFSKHSAELEDLLKELSFLTHYNLIVPFQLKAAKNLISYISLSETNILLRKISYKQQTKFNLQSLYLMKKENNEISFFELKTGIFTHEHIPGNFNGPNYGSEFLINSFNKYLCGSSISDLKINFSEPAVLLETKPLTEASEQTEIFIERPYIDNTLDKFLAAKNSGYLFVIGTYGSGKTTALEHYKIKHPLQSFFSTTFKKDKDFPANFTEIYQEFPKYYLKNSDKFKLESKNLFKDFISHLDDTDEQKIFIFEDIHLLEQPETFLKALPLKLPDNIKIILTMSGKESLKLNGLFDMEVYYIPLLTRPEILGFAEKIRPGSKIIDQETLEWIEDKTFGLPLYCKIMLYEILGINPHYTEKLKNEVKNCFIALINDIEAADVKKPVFKIRPADINSPGYIKYFMSLLAVAREGFNKNEIKNIFNDLSEENIDFYLDKAHSFILKINGRYKIAGEFIENLCLSIISREELTAIHNRVIDFCEPWDKKVSSLTLKYLPYHYLQANRPDDLKNLFDTSFIKSKFKLYPQETLEDIRQLIRYLIKKQPEGLADITKYCFLFQKLKEETKKELLNIVEWCNTGKYGKALSKVEYINKPMEKFYQYLLITFLLASDNKPLEAAKILKTLLLIPDVHINQYNSELIFLMCADMAANGVLEVINLPRSREDGVNLIKNLRDSFYAPKLIEVMLKLLDAIPNELDKTVMLETLMVKVSDFNSMPLVEKFFGDVMPLIEKVQTVNLRDKLYYAYLSSLLKKPLLYSIFLGTVLEKKDKLETPLFKYLYYGNLALLFLQLNQANISRDYIMSAMNLIRDADNINYQGFMFSSMINGLIYFEKTDFYNELINTTFSLISQVSFSYEKIERSLTLLNSIKSYPGQTELLKDLLKDLSGIKEKNILPLLYPYLKAVERIKDKRIKNPLLKKLVSLSDLHNSETRLTLASILVLFTEPNDKNFESLVNMLETGFTDLSKEKAYIIVMDHIAITSEEKYSHKLIEYLLNKILNFNNENSGDLLILKLLNILNRLPVFPGTNIFLDKIFMFANLLPEQKKLKIYAFLSIVLLNTQNKAAALRILHKLFGFLVKESDENRFIIINFLFNNLEQIKDRTKINDFLSDLLTHTFKLIPSVKMEEFIVKIISDVFSNLVKFTFFIDLKNVFYKTLELAYKVNNAVYKENITGIVRYHLQHIKDKNVMVDILQKSILISEENFSQSNIKILSLISIASLNEQAGNIDLANRLFMSILAELRFYNYEEYTNEVLIYFAATLGKFSSKERAVELFKSLILSENGLQEDKYIHKSYSEIAASLCKLGEINLISANFSLLVDKALKIRNESLKVDYLAKLLSYITNFGLSEETKPLILKILNFKNFIRENENLAVFYRAFIISLNKLNTAEIMNYLEEIENNLDSFTDIYLRAETISLLAIAYFKYKNFSKSKELFEQAINFTKRIYDLQNQLDFQADLSIKLFTIGRTDSAKSLMEYSCSTFESIKDENKKLHYLSRFLYKFGHLRSIKKYREYLFNIFEKIIHFEGAVPRLRAYIMLGQAYFKFNEQEYAESCFLRAKNAIAGLGESPETLELMGLLAITMIQSNGREGGNSLLKEIIGIIRVKPKNLRAELSIKLFSALMPLGELQYEKIVFNEVIRLLDEIQLEELNENELFNLGYTYAYKNKIAKFYEVLSFLKNDLPSGKVNRERLLRNVVRIFKEREDFSTLILLLPDVLDDSKTLDYILAALISLVNDPEQTKKITDTIIIY